MMMGSHWCKSQRGVRRNRRKQGIELYTSSLRPCSNGSQGLVYPDGCVCRQDNYCTATAFLAWNLASRFFERSWRSIPTS